MLACARLGAVHSVVFGGFARPSSRPASTTRSPVLVLAASCGIEPNRVIQYKPLLDAGAGAREARAAALRDPAAAGEARARSSPRAIWTGTS